MQYNKVNARRVTNALDTLLTRLQSVATGQQLQMMLADGGFPATQTAELEQALGRVEELIADLTMELLIPFDD